MAEKRWFPNLAGIETCDDTIVKELAEAGIKAETLGRIIDARSEVPTKYIGSINPWCFKRAWRYWIAKGPGILPDRAEKLYAEYGQEVRTDGHCGCPSPKQQYKGFAVPLYHIDTQTGLNAFAELIRNILNEATK